MRPGNGGGRSKAEQPVSVRAKRLISKQLRAVRHYAGRAAKDWEQGPEYVHQLRVATRRARMALVLFSDLLPEKRCRWVKRRLRKLRRVAGHARDLDVLAERLKHTASKQADRHLENVVQKVLKRRRKAQEPLKVAYKKAQRGQFEQRTRDIETAVRWRADACEPTFAEVARARLAPHVDAFFCAAGDLSTIKSLHRMRIAGKRVRYAMELLSDAFPASARRELRADFSEVQDRLGAINDLANAIAAYKRACRNADNKRRRAELEKLVTIEQTKLDARRDAFCEWWTIERAGKLAAQFDVLLSRS